jgi:hypothetical protein
MRDRLVAETTPDNIQYSQERDIPFLVEIEPAIPASERPHIYVLDSAATAIGQFKDLKRKIYSLMMASYVAETFSCIYVLMRI